MEVYSAKIPLATMSAFYKPQTTIRYLASKFFGIRSNYILVVLCLLKKPGTQFTSVLSDRNAVLWFGVSADGLPESRPINLRNVWSRDLTASLIVRSAAPAAGHGPFSIAGEEGPGPQAKVSFAPAATTPCTITYRCQEKSDPGSWTEAKLVIKPHDLGIGKALKATIGLYALNGRAQVDLEGMTFVEGAASLPLGQIPNDVCKVQTLTFVNLGSAHGFVCVKAFQDKAGFIFGRCSTPRQCHRPYQ